jgi:hypothetical protein
MMHYERAMRAAERAGDHRCRATSLLNIGLTELELPDPDLDRVMTYAQQSKEIFEQIKEPHGATYAVHAIGLAYAGRGETAAAVTHFRETLRSAYRLGDLTLVARTLLNIAQHRAQADPILAAEAIGHSDTLFRTLQTFVHSELTASRAAAITQSRNALGDEAFEHHHHIGAALTTHLAVARTLERTDDSLDG